MSGSKDGRHVPPGGVALAARGAPVLSSGVHSRFAPRLAMHGSPAPALPLTREQGSARGRLRTGGGCW
jgi:hypothetical protein